MKTIALRMRPELVVATQGDLESTDWIVEDPITMKYFRLRDQEYFVLKRLTGHASLEEIKTQFEREFAPLRLGMQQLQWFLFHLHELGLVVSDKPGQDQILLERNDREIRNRFVRAFANPLAICLPGISARKPIDRIYDWTRGLFHPLVGFAATALIIAAMLLVLMEFGAFRSRLPSVEDFFDPTTAIWFAVALIGMKACHELGHALVCRHFGVACRELGVMFLVFMPTLYCDVSDTWRLSSQWKRILVSLAGMGVDLFLAAVATFAWWFSELGAVHSIALRMMFLGSVSTLLFNANPFVRCDGYYVLSDLMKVPNLWQESRSLWSQKIRQWFAIRPRELRCNVPVRLVTPVLGFGLLSVIYCTMLVFGILWLAVRLLEPMGFGLVAWMLIAITTLGYLQTPLRKTLQWLQSPQRFSHLDRGRFFGFGAIVFGLILAAFLIPLPHRVQAPVWIELEKPHAVYVSVPGKLKVLREENQSVESGETLARLTNDEVEQQVKELRAEVARRTSHLSNLRRMLADDVTAGPLIPAEEKALEDAKERLKLWEADQRRLTLIAPMAGTIVSPPPVTPDEKAGTRLTGWQGSPLDAVNEGAMMEVGQVLCFIADPARIHATLLIHRDDVGDIRSGQRVRLRLEQYPRQVLYGEVQEVAKTPMEDEYHARVQLQVSPLAMRVGMTGDAKVSAEWLPLGVQICRFIQRTFGFR